MRPLAYFVKSLRENLREWKILVLALVFAPAFVFMMKGYYGAAAPSYTLLVADHDGGAAESAAVIAAWRDARHPGGEPVFRLTPVTDLDAARARVKSRDADLLVEIPAGFSLGLAAFAEPARGAPARLVNHVDARNPRGSMAMALSDYVAFTHAAARTRAPMPLDVVVHPIGSGRSPTEFDLYVPALLVLAIIMTLFTAAASLVKEVDKGTMTRLLLSKLRTGELLAAVSATQVLIGATALALAYGAALACGYRSAGSLAALLVVGALTTLSVVAIGVLTAALLRTIFELLTVGVFPFFVLMFFSDCMFPLPRVRVAAIGAHTLYANDVLPTAVCVKAFNQILSFGAGLGDVAFEIGTIAVLTALYFALGTYLFRRRHQRI